MAGSPASYQIAWTILSELASGGVNHFCICPGSRSTALALAAWKLQSNTLTVHHDERSGGFFALGKSLQTKRPTAIITTSGTAVAELLPAAIEASLSQIPVVFLSADRPRYLRGTGANQTIIQNGILDPYVIQRMEVSVQEVAFLGLSEKGLRERISDMMGVVRDIHPGPLHINVQMEKPFEPPSLNKVFSNSFPLPWPTRRDHRRLSEQKLRSLQEKVAAAKTPVVVVGPNQMEKEFSAAVQDLANAYSIPLLVDPLSGCRGIQGEFCGNVVLSYEALFQTGVLSDWNCDLIIRFGNLPVSALLSNFLRKALVPGGHHLYVNQAGNIADEEADVTDYVQVNPFELCRQLVSMAGAQVSTRTWLARWLEYAAKSSNQIVEKIALEQSWDGGYVGVMLQELPADCLLFAGNSMPIRLLDLVGAVRTESLAVFANRGASGIEGLVSTALGIAHSSSSKVVLLIGDTSLLHDIGGLLALRQMKLENVLIIVLNNDGGGIFGRLPVAEIQGPFEKLFINPHGMDFAGIANAFELPYMHAGNARDFRKSLRMLLKVQQSSVLEVRTNWRKDLRHAKDLVYRVAKSLGE